MLKQTVSKFVQLLVVSILWFCIGWIVRGQMAAVPLSPTETRMVAAAQLLLARHYPTVALSAEGLANAAIRGMVHFTQDPYNALWAGSAGDHFQADFAGQSGDPGLGFAIGDGRFVVTAAPPGSPAATAGLQVGDLLLTVAGTPLDGFTTRAEAAMLLRGPVGSAVYIAVQRGDKRLTFAVARAPRPRMSARLIAGHIGYVKLPAFPAGVAAAMKTALQTLQAQGMDALILDLRDNPGGSAYEAEAILNFFVKEGPLYSAEFKDGVQRIFKADGAAFLTNLPLTVLIDEGSYSAAEIVAAALADHQRALVIGHASGGKGVIQDTIALDEEALLHLTIARWFSPAGHWIQGKGVQPAVIVTDDPATPMDEVVARALLRHRRLTAKADF